MPILLTKIFYILNIYIILFSRSYRYPLKLYNPIRCVLLIYIQRLSSSTVEHGPFIRNPWARFPYLWVAFCWSRCRKGRISAGHLCARRRFRLWYHSSPAHFPSNWELKKGVKITVKLSHIVNFECNGWV